MLSGCQLDGQGLSPGHLRTARYRVSAVFAPAPLGDTPFEILAESAFGARPGRAAAELPTAPDALSSWYRAVVLGGQGRYAAARAELRIVRTLGTDPIVLSLASSTEGSLLRQLGWHARAAACDGRAAALISARSIGDRATGPASADYPFERGDAICDALTGLAADALGIGRVALAWRLLRRCADLVPDNELGWRPAVRRQWVSAETALAAGTVEPALTHAAAALELAERGPSVRHLVKSRLLVAAAARRRTSTTGRARSPSMSPSSVANTACCRCAGRARCCVRGSASMAPRRRPRTAPRPSSDVAVGFVRRRRRNRPPSCRKAFKPDYIRLRGACAGKGDRVALFRALYRYC